MVYRWIYKIKENLSLTDNNRFKVRFIVKGFAQKDRVNFFEIFSPVVRYITIKTMLS